MREEMDKGMLCVEPQRTATAQQGLSRLSPNPARVGGAMGSPGCLGWDVITNHPLSINQSHFLTGLLMKSSCFN